LEEIEMLTITQFTIDHENAPLLVKLHNANFSWILSSTNDSVFQKSYRIIIKEESQEVFDSGMVLDCNSVNITFPKLVLQPATRYNAFLFITDNFGETAQAQMLFSTEIPTQNWKGVG
jgi:alpha-L-rhamnosidase